MTIQTRVRNARCNSQTLVAHQETAKVREPGHRTFYDPAVSSKTIRALDIFARNAIENAPFLTSTSGGGIVGMKFFRKAFGSSRSPGMNDWNGIEHARHATSDRSGWLPRRPQPVDCRPGRPLYGVWSQVLHTSGTPMPATPAAPDGPRDSCSTRGSHFDGR